MTRYSRQDVLRILRIHARQLGAWERSGLIPPSESYSFQDLVQLRNLRDLRAKRVSVASIRASVSAMRSVSGMANPWLEASPVRSGSRVAFRHSGAVMDPIARQFVFDFESQPQARLAQVGGFHTANPAQDAAMQAARQAALQAQVNSMFIAAVQMEEAGELQKAMAAYTGILELDPAHAPSCINLGTLHYNSRQFLRSEELYRRATEADPGYALAFFDHGNVLDELQRLPEAIEAYRNAIRLVPKYADAHYNLALAYERTGERRKALCHWSAYLKLDPVGPWANHARGQARKILERESLSIVHRGLPHAHARSVPARLSVLKQLLRP